MHLTIALSYGGKQDIVQAVQLIAKDVAAGTLDSSQVWLFLMQQGLPVWQESIESSPRGRGRNLHSCMQYK